MNQDPAVFDLFHKYPIKTNFLVIFLPPLELCDSETPLAQDLPVGNMAISMVTKHQSSFCTSAVLRKGISFILMLIRGKSCKTLNLFIENILNYVIGDP